MNAGRDGKGPRPDASAEALRANLARRKRQQRDRAAAGTDGLSQGAAAVLEFWFADTAPGTMRSAWFKKDPEFDAAIRQRFLADVEAAATGARDGWESGPRGALALAILQDQFPRNLFRGEARAFAWDGRARALAERAVAHGFDFDLEPVERIFIYLPFEHSEDIADQRRSLELFESLPPAPWRQGVVDYARRHLEVIERFGRFPHRNAALGRESTREETDFLKTPGSSF